MAGWQELVALLILPPGALIVIALLSFVCYVKWPKIAAVLVAIDLVLLGVLSLPLTARQLTGALESWAPTLSAQALEEARAQAKAIVVLGAGRYAAAPEYEGADVVSSMALERLRYAAHLHRQTGLPILVSGGAPAGEPVPEAELMRVALERDYRITPRWRESRSRSTLENALYSAELLRNAGVKQAMVVTHAWHMRRAIWCFEEAGLRTIPAPTGFHTLSRRERSLQGYLPSARGLYWTSVALRERLAYLWYRLRSKRDRDTPAQREPKTGA